MTDERMIDSDVYKNLVGGPKSTARDIIRHVLAVILILGLAVFIYLGAAGENTMGKIFALLIAVFGPIIYIKMAIKQVKRSARKIEKRQELLESLSDREFYELDDQIKENECFFGSVYLLPDYLYAPKERLLIRYRDIKNMISI